MKKLFLKLFKNWIYKSYSPPPMTGTGLKLYLDDIRPTPEGWTHCFKVEEVQEYLKTRPVEYMSLDHDLGASYLCSNCYDLAKDWRECSQTGCTCECHKTDPQIFPSGYDLVKWMAEHDLWPINKPTIHSANPAGRVNMQATIDRYWHPPGTPKKY